MQSATSPDYAKPFRGAVWTDVLPRARACPGIGAQVLLHAGPPYRGTAPAPVLQAAMQALLYEGQAADERAAARLLGDGSFRLEPAQDHGVVTPLAQVVSASMPLLKVESGGTVVFAALIEGPAPALRFGSLSPACRAALRDTATWVEAVLAPIVRRNPVDIGAIVAAACARGDECHARTFAAHAALLGELGLPAEQAARLDAQPAFVLAVLMGAASAVLRAGTGALFSVGGNGIDFGVRLRDAPCWSQSAAQPPAGPRLSGQEATAALPAVGDSAVIDFCGLGGQAFAAAPELVAEWQGYVPGDATVRGPLLVDPDTGVVDPHRVVRSGLSPLVNLGILDRNGVAGLIGRGLYAAPVELFANACGPVAGMADPAA